MAYLLVIGAVLLAIGYPWPGPFVVAGLLALGAVPAWLHARLGLRLPALLAAAGPVAATVVELVTPGPEIVELGADRVTVGTAVLAGFADAWPQWLGVCLLAGLAEHALRRAAPPGRLAAPGAGLAVGAVLAGLVLASGVVHGWLAYAAAHGPQWGFAYLVVLGAGATALLLRARFVTPWLVLTGAVGLAGVAAWLQPPSDPVAGLAGASWLHLGLALVLGLVEGLVRGVRRLLRRRRARVRTPVSAAAEGRAASPSRS